jgi:hypothetical protein
MLIFWKKNITLVLSEKKILNETKNQTKRVGLAQSEPHHHLIEN